MDDKRDVWKALGWILSHVVIRGGMLYVAAHFIIKYW